MSGRTLLGVWAHPDDEAYLSAGLMAEFRRQGDRVVVVTATAGELGTSDPDVWWPAKLARVRKAELRRSLRALGVDELRWLGLPDGGCDAIDATAEVAELIAEVRPDVIVTFGPDGMTGHPDHRAVSRWTTAAWRSTGSGAALWYATLTSEFHDQWGGLNDEIGLWGDQPEPPVTAVADLALQLELDDELLDRKIAALMAHRSQTQPLIDVVGAERYRAWWAIESFRSAGDPADHDDRGPSEAVRRAPAATAPS